MGLGKGMGGNGLGEAGGGKLPHILGNERNGSAVTKRNLTTALVKGRRKQERCWPIGAEGAKETSEAFGFGARMSKALGCVKPGLH
jgi:hypothetical protein